MWDERGEEEEEEGRAARLRRQWGRRCGRAGRQARGGERVVLQHVCARYDDLSVSVAAQWVTRRRARACRRPPFASGTGRRGRQTRPTRRTQCEEGAEGLLRADISFCAKQLDDSINSK